MADMMTFPATVEEFMEQYKIVDTDKVYTNGTELVPIFRMKQWFEHVSATDTISRQAAMELLITALCDGWDLDYAEERVQSLPPTSPDMSGYSRRLWKAAYERGKAEGQRTGKWIKPTFIQNRAFDIVHCSECGGVPCGVDENTHYCPNCGVKMKGVAE